MNHKITPNNDINSICHPEAAGFTSSSDENTPPQIWYIKYKCIIILSICFISLGAFIIISVLNL